MVKFLGFSWMAMLIGFLLDCLFGDPVFKFHPIRLIGNLISLVENKIYPLEEKKRLKNGVCLVVIVISVTAIIVGILRYAAYMIHPYVFLVVESVLVWLSLAMKSLNNESMKVYYALETGDLDKSRYAVSMIVGRDTNVLDEKGIMKAAVETVAENTSDGVVAPMMYTAILGSFGGYIYKAVNTMDSMVGYKNDKYMMFGRCAAKLDDVVNYIPSRLSAIFMIIAAFILKLDYKGAYTIFLRDRYKHASPNSAQTESVCAGALGLQLAGDAWYKGVLLKKDYIGDKKREIDKSDIKKACLLMIVTSIISLVCFMLIKGAICLVMSNMFMVGI